MKHLLPIAAIACLAVAAACSEPTAPAPANSAARAYAAHDAARSTDRITVYTQNLYVGADVDAIIDALTSGDQGAAFAALANAVATLHRTDFDTRAAAIADEIARSHPDVVGFQEGSKIDVDLTQLGYPQLVAHEDFLASLGTALATRGLTNYTVVDTVTDVQASLLFGLVSLIDYDIMLVNTDRVTVNSHHKQNFVHNDGPLGSDINLVRGFIRALITVEGRDYVVATTHAEGTDLTALGIDYHQLHVQQMQEIVDDVNQFDLPAIVMGDLNDADTTPMYDVLLDAGFADLWRTLRPGVAGNTCCHLSDLSDPRPGLGEFEQRIDYIFVRGFAHSRAATGQITRFGLLPSDRLTGPDGTIWPSDHVGLVATLVVPGAEGVTP